MQPITVGQVTREIKSLLDKAETLQDIWVTGEVSNLTRATSGHCYFTLQDNEATLRCVMWRNVASRLSSLPATGDSVDVLGYVSVYERGGAYQFYVNDVRSGGVGQLWLAFLQVKERLEREGMFGPEHKRAIPPWPKRIGVVTSASGAAIQDILNVLGQRYPLVHVVLSPSLVQGTQAPEALQQALGLLYRLPDLDLIIIARGGGSIEDLWAFNDEALARLVHAAPVPVISGVGHETDFTITDFVADLRTPTPSTAAAAAVPDGEALRIHIYEEMEALTELIEAKLQRLRDDLMLRERALERNDPTRSISSLRQQVDDLMRRAQAAWALKLRFERSSVAAQRARLQALSPLEVLGRGYAIVQDRASGQRIVSVQQTQPSQDVQIHLADGAITARVTEP